MEKYEVIKTSQAFFWNVILSGVSHTLTAISISNEIEFKNTFCVRSKQNQFDSKNSLIFAYTE